jgi:hypothetical protein
MHPGFWRRHVAATRAPFLHAKVLMSAVFRTMLFFLAANEVLLFLMERAPFR